jgi:hypothetical protein
MAADIYTKEFTDADKWNALCRQIGLYSPENINKGDLLSLFISRSELRSEKRGESSIYEATAITSVMPEELHGLRSALGTHDNIDGSQHIVVREPKLYRTPKNVRLNRRSTWILKNTEWKQVEDGTDWAKCPNRRFEEWTEKAIFYFWEEPEEVVNNACPVLQQFVDGPHYRPKPRLADAFGAAVETIVDVTFRNVMVGHQPLSHQHRCDNCGNPPYWCCRDCRKMLCMGCSNQDTRCECVRAMPNFSEKCSMCESPGPYWQCDDCDKWRR